jgi:hypothetical protein
VPSIGSTFKIMNFTSETGMFATVNGLAINSAEHFIITYQPTDVLLSVVSGALATGLPVFNVGPIPGSSLPGILDEGGSGHAFFAYTGSIRPAVVAELNTPSSVPGQGSTFALLLIALFGCALFHWYSTSRRLV